jgi:DnaJ-class molecular chaperone
VHVVVDTPTELSEEAADLLRKFAAARGETVNDPSPGLFGRIKSAFS